MKNWMFISTYSHGTSIGYMDTELLKLFDDIDISIDFPNWEMHDKWRGNKWIFNKAIEWIKKCKSLGLNVSIVSVLMKNNCRYLKDFKEILDLYDVNLRINLYKSVNTDEYTPDYDEFWDTISDFNDNFKIVSCSEPILALVCDEVKSWSLCWNSIRIHPDWEISSCVYIKDWASNKEFNIEKDISPTYCNECKIKDKCKWWCFWRRVSNQRKEYPDMYCPFYNHKPVPTFKLMVQQDAKELIHSSYLCTLILR